MGGRPGRIFPLGMMDLPQRPTGRPRRPFPNREITSLCAGDESPEHFGRRAIAESLGHFGWRARNESREHFARRAINESGAHFESREQIGHYGKRGPLTTFGKVNR